MKIFECKRKEWGFAFTRISEAFRKYSPKEIEWVNTENEADVLLVHIVGPGELEFLQTTKPFIIIQHCYFTAGYQTADYDEYWEKSLLTISFHNLVEYTDKKFNFYHMPWGASPEIFYPILSIAKDTPIIATGHVAYTECLDKIFEACKELDISMIHTGENFEWDGRYYSHYEYMNDDMLNLVLNKCEYVSALRIVEGFELMAIEGLFCGVRPIIPNEKTYDWYRKYGYTIDMSQDIVVQLKNILSKEPKPFTQEERDEIVKTFSWQNIMNGFYTELAKYKIS